MKPTFIVWSKFGELLDVAIQLKQEKCEVFLYVSDHDYTEIGEGIVPKLKDWEWLDCLGKGYIWCLDGCDDGHFQDWLRDKGEFVFGGSKQGDVTKPTYSQFGPYANSYNGAEFSQDPNDYGSAIPKW